MIVVEITHGLGNQLFQYAAARRLAHHHGTVLKLDVFGYRRNKFRRYALDRFNINAEIATWRDIYNISRVEAAHRVLRKSMPEKMSSLCIRVLNKIGLRSSYHARVTAYVPGQPLPSLRLGRLVPERFYHFDEEVLSCPDNVSLMGYWQSEKYFRDVSDIIRKELGVKIPLSGKNLETADQIAQSNSVSLHVRRGDKVGDKNHCASGVEFCMQAMEFIRGKLPDAKFFVFSDDPAWVKANIAASENVVHVDHNDDEANYEDLRLMSLCKHNIIAPSSFSWWAAWLNANPQKIVVRPKAWINMENHDTKDVFPADWITLD